MSKPDKERDEAETIDKKVDVLVSELHNMKSLLENISKKQSEFQFKVTWIFTMFAIGSGFIMAGLGFFASWWFYTFRKTTIFLEYSLILIIVGVTAIVIANRYAKKHFRTD